MSVISIEKAMEHLRAEAEDNALVQAMLDAAEESASQFMQRRFYADATERSAALLAVPAARNDARAAFDQARAAAATLARLDDRTAALAEAQEIFDEALRDCVMQARGILINKAIQAACLLIVGHLFANREDVVTGVAVTELPMGSQHLLWPYRIGLGV
ncbi:head-tail connector protein [Pseudomonas typographi]|uniref:Phage gp6-like head-tail connector protein n=1 Tax=Pseudomonas typographi TaxID=2715964 RepID=A0ABR7Z6W0_9PSED|nr:head-tail connector protein [Pseudomonas typographi]MBD1601182.1 phage gp6-like head-tail connector protein [Pseudomonas typographi]